MYNKKFIPKPAMVAQAYNPITWESEAGDFCEFEASLIYTASSGQLGLQSETLSQKQTSKQRTRDKEQEIETSREKKEVKTEEKEKNEKLVGTRSSLRRQDPKRM